MISIYWDFTAPLPPVSNIDDYQHHHPRLLTITNQLQTTTTTKSHFQPQPLQITITTIDHNH
jgi:hypothetical protein